MQRTLVHLGTGYTGVDPDTGALVKAHAGAMLTVSDAKAAQLLADFPREWQEVVAVAVPATPADDDQPPAVVEPDRRKPGRPRHTKAG